MKQITTKAIILHRTDYGEADRILTLLTPDYGKLSLIAKGVRRIKSKLAGGIELFSVSDISYIKGRSDMGTLISTRLEKHYGHIVEDVTRTMLGYELIKQLHRATEDAPEEEYFDLLQQSFAALNDKTVDAQLVRTWFSMQLLRIGGHTPNLHTERGGDKLVVSKQYEFSFDDMSFYERSEGKYGADHIKFLRVGFSGNSPFVMQKITGGDALVIDVAPLVQTMATTYVRGIAA